MSEESGGVWIREGPRVPFESTARLGVEDREDGSPYRTENLSLSGVMLRGERPLFVVGAVSFRFHSPAANLQGTGTVAWVRRVPSAGQGDYLIGFTFLEVSEESAAAIEGLLSGAETVRAAVEAPSLEPPSEGFPGSLQVAEKRRGKRVGQENPAPVDVVPPTPETLQEGSGLRLGSVLGGDAARFVVRIADLEGPLDKSLPSLKTPEAIGIRAGWHETERGGELHLIFDLTSADVVASAEVSAGAIVVSLDHID